MDFNGKRRRGRSTQKGLPIHYRIERISDAHNHSIDISHVRAGLPTQEEANWRRRKARRGMGKIERKLWMMSIRDISDEGKPMPKPPWRSFSPLLSSPVPMPAS